MAATVLDKLEMLKKHCYGQLLSKRIDQFSVDYWPAYYDSAYGTHIVAEGRTFLDLSISGIGACTLGYANPEINDAVIRQINRGVASSINSKAELELTERLLTLHQWAESVRYTRSGGEAMAVACRLARAATGKNKVLFCGYHGWSDWFLAANIQNRSALDNHLIQNLEPKGVPLALAGSAIPFDFNRVDSFCAALDIGGDDIAAIVLEPARAKVADAEWLAAIRRHASARGIALIFDEISSGFRETIGGFHLGLGVSPDVAVFSKALGNGFAISAVVGTNDWIQPGSKNFISSTNWTEAVGFAAGAAVIDFYWNNPVIEKLSLIGNLFQKMISEFSLSNPELGMSSTGIPALSSWGVKEDADVFRTLVTQLGIEEGVLIGARMYPNYMMEEHHIEKYRNVLARAAEIWTLKDQKEVVDLLGKVMPMGLNEIVV